MFGSIKTDKNLRIIFFNIFAVLFLTQVALASYDTKYNDEFDSGTLDVIRWHWIRESPTNWIMNGTSFQMNVTNSDMYQNTATAPLLLQYITDNNISIITKLSAVPATNSEGGGLIFYKNDNNFVQYEYFTRNGGATKSLVLKKEENNVAVYNYSFDITSVPIYLMLNKIGTSYTAYYSTSEGGSWIKVYNYTLNTSVNQAGLITAGAGSSSGNAFIYDYFRAIRSDTMSSITDPLSTTNNFWINNTWVNPSFVDFNQTMFKFANDTVYMNVSNTTDFLNITYSPHYIQNLSAQTMDTSGNVNSIRVWFNASIPNNIPVLAGISDRTLTAGTWLNFTVSATDADSDTLTYGTDATKGSLDPITGEFTWLTTGSDAGTYIWEFSSSDIYGGIDTETITVTVNAAAALTYFPPSPVSIAGSQGNFWINYTWSSGPGNVTDSYNISINGAWNNESAASYSNSTLSAHGWSNISVYAFNSSGTGTLNPIPLAGETQINNNAPVLAGILDKTVTAGTWLDFTVSATDSDGDTLNYGTDATKGSFDPITGKFTWLTTGSDAGTYIWEFSSSDIYGGIDTETITVTVNAAPTYLPPSPVSIAGSQGNFWINYTWSSGPGNVTDSYNVSVNGVWNNESASSYSNSTLSAHGWSNISVYAFNSSGTGTLNPIPLAGETQINNNAPVLAGILDKTLTAGTWLDFTVSATDADSDTLTYSTDATKGSLDPITGEFTWLTTGSDAGTYIWEFSSSDIYGGIDTETITVTINAVPSTGGTPINNNAPILAGILDKTVTAGTWLNFTVSATDSDGDTLTYGTDATKGSLDPITGKFAWLTTGSDAGTYIWEFSSSDNYGGIDTETITVTVNAAAALTYFPPSPVSISSSQGNFWINYTWSSGPGNVTDSYNISINGVWNNESAASHTNSTLSAHGWSNISVYAFNSSGTGTLNPIPLAGEKQINNNAPVLAGILDKTLTAGTWLNFTVSATDADSDTLTYGTDATKGSLDPITGKFAWLTTGSDAGTYIWEFSSSDSYGGIDTEIITITVNAAITTTTSTGSSSDSGIGGGVVSAEPYDNIERSDMYEKYLLLNNPVLYTFKFPELSIYEIAVIGKETENYMALKVEALKGPTKNPGISAVSGIVYKNVNVLASSKNIKEAQIRFKVENTWIANAGNDLTMVKWDGSKWVDLPTSEIKKDDTYTFYEANTDSFGSFAITAMNAEVVPAEVVDNSKVILAPLKASSTPVPTKTPGFEAIIAVFAIAMLAALLKNNGQRR